jgi:hypothetical protein
MSLARQSHSKMERHGKHMNCHPHPHQSSINKNCSSRAATKKKKKKPKTWYGGRPPCRHGCDAPEKGLCNSPRLRPGTKIIKQNNLFTLQKNKGINRVKNSRVKPRIILYIMTCVHLRPVLYYISYGRTEVIFLPTISTSVLIL